jgi:hypothetical protein
MFLNVTETISSIVNPSAYDTTVREHSRHYRDLSLANDHQSDLDIRDDPCVFYEVLLVVEP